MHLPGSERVPTNILSAVFSNTSATYKFYWFLSIIDRIEHGEQHISKKKLFAGMVASAWHTINYFHLYFGRQDLLQQTAKTIFEIENLTVDIPKEELRSLLECSANKHTAALLQHFNKNVPHWFLTPWFPKIAGMTENDSTYRARIYAGSSDFANDCLYSLSDEYITINPLWLPYLQGNAKILRDFCYWNLTAFLQVRNPNVPDINGKLIKPPFRGSLITQRRNYWDIVFSELGSIRCIFTGNRLKKENYALDHFIPHAFVAHDLIWNLLPIDQSFNSYKSDRLVAVEEYFDQFFIIQKMAFEIISGQNPKNKFLEEYYHLFPSLASSAEFDYKRYKETIQPLVAIAHNNGFLYLG